MKTSKHFGLLFRMLMLVFLAAASRREVQSQDAESDSPTRRRPRLEAESFPESRSFSPFRRDEIVVFGHDVHVRANETCRELIVIGGNATIEGNVRGNVVVLFGSTKVTGTVGRDLITVLGPCDLNGEVRGSFVNVLGAPTFGPDAVVERQAIAIGGRLNLDPAAVINGARREFAFGQTFSWLGEWCRNGLFLARPLPPQLVWAWVVVGILLAFYVLVAVLFPRPINACVRSLDEAPVGSFFVGLTGLVLFIPVLVLLSVTVVGVPVLILSLAVALVFGKVAIFQFAGQQVGRQINSSGLQLPLVALLIGAAIFYLLYVVPLLGFLAWGIGMVWGLGGVLMALFDNLKRETSGATPVLLPSASVLPANPPGISEGAVPPLTETPTPSNPVPGQWIQFERAGFWVRVWAAAIDLILVGVASAVIGLGISFPFLLLAYHVAMWTWKATTIGGIVFGLKVVRLDGRPTDFAVALIRSLFSIISAVFFLFGFFWAGWDKEKQSWHDKIAGTVIVKVPKGVSLI